MMLFHVEHFDESGQELPVLRFESAQRAIDKAYDLVDEMEADGVQGYASVNQYHDGRFVAQVFWWCTSDVEA